LFVANEPLASICVFFNPRNCRFAICIVWSVPFPCRLIYHTALGFANAGCERNWGAKASISFTCTWLFEISASICCWKIFLRSLKDDKRMHIFSILCPVFRIRSLQKFVY
jgi:hypothetical protein